MTIDKQWDNFKRARKRSSSQFSSDADVDTFNPVPQPMRLNAIMMKRMMQNDGDDAVARWSIGEVSAREERLDKLWCDLNTKWEALCGHIMTNAELKVCSDFFGEITDEYLHFKAQARNRIGQANTMQTDRSSIAPTSGSQFLRIQLAETPKVPKFSGREIDWANFRTIFVASVHENSQLSNTQKMQLL